MSRGAFRTLLQPAFARNDGLARFDQLVRIGADARRIRRAVDSGWWAEPLPGVICEHSGPLTARQRRVAAVLLAAPHGLISHRTAAALHGLRTPDIDEVHVTVPHGSALRSQGFVVVHQTARSTLRTVRQGVPATSVPRSLVDTALLMPRRSDVRAVFADAVQRRLVTVAEVTAELDCAPRRGSAHLRAALEEVGAGARSAPEADVYRLIQRSGLPMPRFNVPVVINGIRFILDGLWDWLRAGLEVDSLAYHLLPDDWDQHLTRQNEVQSGGLVLIRLTTVRLRRDRAGAEAALRRFLVARAEELGVPLHRPASWPPA